MAAAASPSSTQVTLRRSEADQGAFWKAMQGMYDEGRFCDVQLVADKNPDAQGSQQGTSPLCCHSLILAGLSRTFSTALKGGWQHDCNAGATDVLIPDVRAKEVQKLLDALYHAIGHQSDFSCSPELAKTFGLQDGSNLPPPTSDDRDSCEGQDDKGATPVFVDVKSERVLKRANDDTEPATADEASAKRRKVTEACPVPVANVQQAKKRPLIVVVGPSSRTDTTAVPQPAGMPATAVTGAIKIVKAGSYRPAASNFPTVASVGPTVVTKIEVQKPIRPQRSIKSMKVSSLKSMADVGTLLSSAEGEITVNCMSNLQSDDTECNDYIEAVRSSGTEGLALVALRLQEGRMKARPLAWTPQMRPMCKETMAGQHKDLKESLQALFGFSDADLCHQQSALVKRMDSKQEQIFMNRTSRYVANKYIDKPKEYLRDVLSDDKLVKLSQKRERKMQLILPEVVSFLSLQLTADMAPEDQGGLALLVFQAHRPGMLVKLHMFKMDGTITSDKQGVFFKALGDVWSFPNLWQRKTCGIMEGPVQSCLKIIKEYRETKRQATTLQSVQEYLAVDADSPPEVITCTYCPKTFNGWVQNGLVYQMQYLNHRNKYHWKKEGRGEQKTEGSENSRQCAKCGAKLETGSAYATHMQNHFYADYSCDCGVEMSSFLQKREHVQLVHQDYVRCQLCQNIVKQEDMRKHLILSKIHRGTQECNVCQRDIGGGGKAMLLHLEQEHSEEERELARSSQMCKDCGETFPSLDDLKKHATQHETSTCEKCGEKVTGRGKMRSHMDRYHSGPVTCDQCQCTLHNKLAFRSHFQTHHQPYKCTTCKAVIVGRYNLKAHRRKEHPEECSVSQSQLSVCHLCGKETAHMEQHLQHHTNMKCKICGEVVLGRTRMDTHMRLVHSAEPEKTCEECGIVLPNLKAFWNHNALQHKKYDCNICGEVIQGITVYRKHQKAHESKDAVKCNICSQLLANEARLRMHVDGLHNPTSCHVCGTICEGTVGLRIHRQEKHKDLVGKRITNRDTGPPCACEHCGKTFANSHKLCCHRIQQHKPYTCQECGESFQGRLRFAAHKRVAHGSDPPRECPKCGEVLATKASLTKHDRRVHREFKCELCGEALVGHNKFLAHKKKHEQ